MIAENPGNYTGWGTDWDGNLRIAITTDGVNTSLLMRKTEADKFDACCYYDLQRDDHAFSIHC